LGTERDQEKKGQKGGKNSTWEGVKFQRKHARGGGGGDNTPISSDVLSEKRVGKDRIQKGGRLSRDKYSEEREWAGVTKRPTGKIGLK